MRVIFLGVGEAIDENYANTSLIVESRSMILLDCGYSTAQSLWRFSSEPELVDAVYISHQHGDHTFGIPAVLMRMWEDARKKDLTFLCTPGMKDYILKLMDISYKGFMERFQFKINFLEFDRETRFKEFKISVAESRHSAVNHAIRLETGKKVVCYSGDGMFTGETAELYKNADILVHESYNIESMSGHAGIKDLIEMVAVQKVRTLALVHISRKLRKDRERIKGLISGSHLRIIVPEALDSIEF